MYIPKHSGKKVIAVNNEMFKGFSTIFPVELTTGIKLSREELLEVSQNISRYYAPKISHASRNIVVLPIDPQHLFVYWNLGDEQAKAITSNEVDNELRLRVYSQSRQSRNNFKTKLFHDFAINPSRSSQTIKLPKPESEMIYSASIGTKVLDNDFIPLLICNYIPTLEGPMKQRDSELNKVFSKDIPASDAYEFVYKEGRIKVIDEGILYQSSVSVKTHYASTNCSGLGGSIEE